MPYQKGILQRKAAGTIALSPESRLKLGNWIMISGLVAIAIGIIMISGHGLPKAFGANTTALNQTMQTMEPFLVYPDSLNIFYPVFLLVMLCLFMAVGLRLRKEQFAVIFPIGSLILCLVLTFVFLAPVDFVYSSAHTKVTIEEITWAGTGNVTYNTMLEKDTSNVILISKSDQFRFTIAAVFGGLMIFNALFSILVLTSIGNKK